MRRAVAVAVLGLALALAGCAQPGCEQDDFAQTSEECDD